MNRIRAIIGVALAALATAGTYLGTYIATSGTVAHSLRRAVAIDDAAITRWVSRDGKEVRFATLEGTPTPMPWTHRPYRYDVPANAREVPVIAPQRTPLVRDGFNRFTGDGRVKYHGGLNAVVASSLTVAEPTVPFRAGSVETRSDV